MRCDKIIRNDPREERGEGEREGKNG